MHIQFTDHQPKNTWAVETPNEYGFYANVNPTVDHPRWSQARERRLPSLFKDRPTLMFNGYGEQVASLYAGMDLRKYSDADVKRLSGWIDAVAGWRFFKPLVFLACLTPGTWLAYRAYQALALGQELALGADPVKTFEHETGLTALTILLITLSITPVRRLLHANRLQRVRRMLGVWSFTYALMHLSHVSGLRSELLLGRHLRVPRDLGGHPQATVHLRRDVRVFHPARARDHVDERLGAAPQEKLAAPPSSGLRRGDGGHRALHLDSEIRFP